MPKPKVYVLVTAQRDYYTRDLDEAEQSAEKWHAEIKTYESLDEALKQHDLTPVGNSDTRTLFLPSVRLTPDERAKIEAEATAAGKSKLSDYIRSRLGLE